MRSVGGQAGAFSRSPPHPARWPRALDPGPSQDCQGHSRQGAAAPLQPLRGAGVPLRQCRAPSSRTGRAGLGIGEIKPACSVSWPPSAVRDWNGNIVGLRRKIAFLCDATPHRFGDTDSMASAGPVLAGWPQPLPCLPGSSAGAVPGYQNEAQPAADSSNKRRVPRRASDSDRPFG